jgi:hypothetical protein
VQLVPGTPGNVWNDPALRVTGQPAAEGEPAPQLTGRFDHAWYAYDGDHGVDVVLLEGDPDQPVQAVIIRMLWRPTDGLTTTGDSVTNATVQYLVFPATWTTAGRQTEAGIYSGAGHLDPSGVGGARLTGSVSDATLRLTDASARFDDVLGRASVTGSFGATRDDAAVRRAIRRLQVLLRQRLGYPRLVDDADAKPVIRWAAGPSR